MRNLRSHRRRLLSSTVMPGPHTQLPPATGEANAVLIPVKAFDQAKGRLSKALEPTTRARLAREMATNLVGMQGDLPVAVCCDDPAVAEWAISIDASVIWCPGTGLNGAVQQGVHEFGRAGYRSVAVAHSDLPLATSLRPLLGWPGITIVPDRHRQGSNVIALPTDIDFQFSYGSGSFERHVREAIRHRLGLRIAHDDRLGWDVDEPVDLDPPEHSLVQDLLQHELCEGTQ